MFIGIAKGTRRIVALTRGDAQRAVAEGQRLEAQVASAAGQADVAELDKALTTCRQVRCASRSRHTDSRCRP